MRRPVTPAGRLIAVLAGLVLLALAALAGVVALLVLVGLGLVVFVVRQLQAAFGRRPSQSPPPAEGEIIDADYRVVDSRGKDADSDGRH